MYIIILYKNGIICKKQSIICVDYGNNACYDMNKEKAAGNRFSKRRTLRVNYIQSKEIKIQQKKFLNVIKDGD